MSAPVVHAPDGGGIVGDLCEEPTGDVTLDLHGVDCPDCLDILDSGVVRWSSLVGPLTGWRANR